MSAARRRKKQRTKHFQSYVCANCDGRFRYAKEKDWSDGDALKELGTNFGVPVEQCDRVCDPCYRRIRAWSSPRTHAHRITVEMVFKELAKEIARAIAAALLPVVLKEAEKRKAERN